MRTVSVISQEHGLLQNVEAGAHKWLSDAGLSEGGNAAAPDPHELLLGALGACTSMTLQIYSRRRGWDLRKVSINLSEERIDDPENPGRHMTVIRRDISVDGSFSPEQLKALTDVANKCPIHKLLVGPKTIMTSLLPATDMVRT